MLLKPHTRHQSSTKNKPSVYLMAAVEDKAEKEELVELLLSHAYGANLCVWESDSLLSKEELESLGDMNLFVIVVTKTMAASYAKEAAEAIRFAYEKMIPVMPVYYLSPNSAMEPMKSFFTTVNLAIRGKQGKMELDGPRHHAGDFKEQFSRKLRQLVAADEVVGEIEKDVFHKQIFLSYRKKDRKQAMEVMKAIHDLPWCEALAIWFDDFLVAGQDFNEEIQKQLFSSDAFALVVTDRLLEKDRAGRDNYVVRVEWDKAAKAMGEKDRLLVEADTINPEDFKGIQPPFHGIVPIANKDGLLRAIQNSCAFDTKREKPSPRQKYLLAMAYLTGIRVEKDMERAVRLLKEAADEACIEACLQLALMHLARIGVERNDSLACEWKEKAFALAEKANDVELAYKAAFGRDGLVLLLYAGDRQKDARAVCQRMRKLLAKETSPRKDWLAETYIEEAEIHYDPEPVSQALLQSCEASAKKGIEELKNATEDAESRYILAKGYATLGNVHACMGMLEEAEQEYRHALSLAQELVKETEGIDYRHLLAWQWNALGILYKEQFQYEKAYAAFSKAVVLGETIAEETDLLADRETCAYACYNCGLVDKDFARGEEMAKKAIAMMERIVEETSHDHHAVEQLEQMKQGLKRQQKKPLVANLVSLVVILAILAVIGACLYFLMREILA